MRGFLTCRECGYSLASCWLKNGTGKLYPYHHSHHKRCSQRGKSIARDKLESEFEQVLKGLTLTAETFELAGQMFRDARGGHRSNTKGDSSRQRTRLRQIDTEVRSLVDRVTRTQHEETAHAREKRIADVRSETEILDETLAKQAVPVVKFDEICERPTKFLASPWVIWEKGSHELTRTVLCIAFSAPLRVSRETGLRTSETNLPFKALRFLSTSECKMVPPHGLEPRTY